MTLLQGGRGSSRASDAFGSGSASSVHDSYNYHYSHRLDHSQSLLEP